MSNNQALEEARSLPKGKDSVNVAFTAVLAGMSGLLAKVLMEEVESSVELKMFVAAAATVVCGALSHLFLTYFSGAQSHTSMESVAMRPFPKLTILYGTQTGNCLRLAKHLKAVWNKEARKSLATCYDVSEYEPETLLEECIMDHHAVVVIMSTYTGGTPPPKAEHFMAWLKDVSLDFRRDRTALKHLTGIAVYGLGSTSYTSETFCKPALECAQLLQALGAVSLFNKEALTKTMDVPCGDSETGDFESEFVEWTDTLLAEFSSGHKTDGERNKTRVVKRGVILKSGKGSAGRGKRNKKKLIARKKSTEALVKEADLEEEEEDIINDFFVEQEKVTDMEDMGGIIMQQTKQKKHDAASKKGPAEMVTPRQRASLTKEGYKIIGTHSAVKLCRWTKNQLRGRGGCYKHTCYGITSYQCMEATPSLACANKCTFCWRHHKNPVGTSWRWKEDDPAFIVKQALAGHDQMVKQMKGVPGVKPERLQEAQTVQHCALSLVGEPIMYPRINELVGELHSRKISSFLVTNAQFPEQVEKMDPVTQLYVSIDASTRESLEAVDRPLFKDFWERFQLSLRHLKRKKQRTVYRLTLVKEHNMDEVREYAELVSLGHPDLIEIKSVTFCGTSDASDLTFSNVPFHEEVVAFSTDLCNYINEDMRKRKALAVKLGNGTSLDEEFPEYGIASEHQHSNLVLIAKMKYYMKDEKTNERKWHTWIDYPKFHACWKKWKDSEGRETFTTEDYLAETPSWAVYGSDERGMDPLENRWFHNRTVRRAQAGELSEMQLKQYPFNPAEQGILDNSKDNSTRLAQGQKVDSKEEDDQVM